ncbi:endonuclease NucS domain-containing protein [uncultured Cocleimonas sp.]|uniref:endonuclease NucS domain-containing protein n=1 Tax=uncultured Cocleimonas sp. TaxID=1051587 RepID=UPI00260F6F18|nr:endonuclease NucS domain-containing protein [uncultured Cocleimonas sp.]
MSGAKSAYFNDCYEHGFIGGDWGIHQDLSNDLTEAWQDFNKKFIPVFLEAHPEKSKIAAGLACGMLHTICKGMNVGDIILTPNGSGQYFVGELISEYYYEEGQILPHRRRVKWYKNSISREEMSEQLKNSAGSIGTVSNLSKYVEEIESLLSGKRPPSLTHSDENVEDPTVFALEKHLEDFLIANWQSTELGSEYNIFSDEGVLVGQQYPSDTGPIDILAISKDEATLLVVELKRGRASDVVVGQIQRYMGYVKDVLAEPHQQVKGVIIALEDDLKLKRALSIAVGIEFYRYQVSFKLLKT